VCEFTVSPGDVLDELRVGLPITQALLLMIEQRLLTLEPGGARALPV
jgi:hypothetical protein